MEYQGIHLSAEDRAIGCPEIPRSLAAADHRPSVRCALCWPSALHPVEWRYSLSYPITRPSGSICAYVGIPLHSMGCGDHHGFSVCSHPVAPSVGGHLSTPILRWMLWWISWCVVSSVHPTGPCIPSVYGSMQRCMHTSATWCRHRIAVHRLPATATLCLCYHRISG